MSDDRHLTRERIAAIIDEPVLPGPIRDHLDACPACRHEFEQMSRMRMALSACGDLEPPAGQWSRILGRLEGAGGVASDVVADSAGDAGANPDDATRRRSDAGVPRRRWLDAAMRVAAALVLTTAGVAAGLQLGGSGAGDDASASFQAPGDRVADSLVANSRPERPAEYAAAAEDYLRAVGDVAMLRGDGWPDSATDAGPPDAEMMAARLARLDALAGATREALRSAPADPVLNNLLFDIVEERSDLSNQLGETLHLATLEMY